ncbi:SDR family NAD(P)-dependent oxidoreductase [Deinococcus marmoris]|uniref:Short chain dehydrogenase n=1 Tax=Deinococcus marmoris TaxID=249408 RepID=A0A1U7NRB7_9DEIO|nr:SDR family NAD(P)-dependent oxidoreductase [Deinococcus marmoris]OLV15469.1 Short chain dehydrogenase [Deinococcus marmoris]
MKTAFITGANKSIGFETARQLLQQGYHVYLGSRTLENGLKAVQQLNSEGLHKVEAIQIDVTDQGSVKTARAEIGFKTETLDVLINNAGINGGMPQSALQADISAFRRVFDTNYFGVVMQYSGRFLTNGVGIVHVDVWQQNGRPPARF